MSRAAVVTRVDQRTGPWAARALIDRVDHLYLTTPDPAAAQALRSWSPKVEIVAHDVASAADWDALAGVIAEGGHSLAILVNGAADPGGAARFDSDFAAFARRGREVLKGAWLGMRALTPLMTAPEAVVINLCLGAGDGAWRGEAESLRVMGQSVVIDGHRAGRPLRINRLLFDPHTQDEAAFMAAIRALVDPRGAFMTGAEIVLTDAFGAETAA
jgi:hypothetical protein